MLKVNLAQQMWQEELGKLDVASERWDEDASMSSAHAPCFWEMAGRMEPVLGVPWPSE